MDAGARIYVAGSRTLVGAALVRELARRGHSSVLPASPEPDLTDRDAVEHFFAREHPTHVFVAAGRTGGIGANQNFPASLMLDNLLTSAHVIDAAHRHHAKKLVYIASSCSYPRDCAQPMKPEALMTGPLEPTSESYATAKLAAIQLCRAYRKEHGDRFVAAIPANPFGPGDDFGHDSHVIAALMRRAHEAKTRGTRVLEVWGTGRATREFVYADDVADGCIHVMDHYDADLPINVGSGVVLSIAELTRAVAGVVGFQGDIAFDATKPDGVPTKALDSGTLKALGWRARTDFRTALEATYIAFQNVLEVE